MASFTGLQSSPQAVCNAVYLVHPVLEDPATSHIQNVASGPAACPRAQAECQGEVA